jgi:hypothetical protein
MLTYDAQGALDILGAFAEKQNPSGSLREKDLAARRLLEEFASLDGQMADLTAIVDTRYQQAAVAVSVGFASAVVTYMPRAAEFVVLVDDIKFPVPVRFNRARNAFEGDVMDASRVPTPGEPKECPRDALTVIAEVVVEALKKQV